MAGIISYGAYIPLWRLARDAIAEAWGSGSIRGERSVANNDEDTITMSIEAAIDCSAGLRREEIDGLYFASTTSPYKEKECSTLVAMAADLKPEIITADFANSLTAGTAALRAALDAVVSGSAGQILVTASDCRIGYPGSNYEQTFGDAAVALLIGNTDKPAVIVESSYSLSNELYDVWRLEKDIYVQSWEDRFIIEHGYIENMERAISGLLQKKTLSTQDINKAVLYAPTLRAQQRLARRLGFDVNMQLQDLLINNVGITGCAPAVQYHLTVSSTEGGKVASPGEGTFTCYEGRAVILMAAPRTGYRFVNWTGDVSTIADVNSAQTTITICGNYSIMANFEKSVGGGCFIATAAYGTPMADEIQILREFRDEYLLTNPLGQALVDIYYKVSPPIAEFITRHPSLKPIIRVELLPFVVVSKVIFDIVPEFTGNDA